MPIPSRNQQGFQIAQPGEAPRECILLVEPQTAHNEFLEDNEHVSTVVLRITHAQTLVKRGETASTYFGPDVTVVTTTTISDRELSDLEWEEERDTVLDFAPDYHVPCDYPVYYNQSEEERQHYIQEYLEGLVWMAGQLADTNIRVIPLIKGTTSEEREQFYRVFEYLGATYCAFYGTQYFTAGKGFYKLLEDVCAVADEAPGLSIWLMGLQHPPWLEQMPMHVVAASGQRWIDEVGLRDVSLEASRQKYPDVDKAIRGALSAGHAPLGMWAEHVDEEVTAYGQRI